MKTYIDERGFRAINIFDMSNGQVNIQYFYNTESSKIHSHPWSDTLYVINGDFEITTYITELNYRGHKIIKNYLSSKHQITLYIPPNVPHSFRALTPNSILLYQMSEQYDTKKVTTL